MSAIDPAQVRHVAKLARLELSEEEVELFSRQLGDVLDYVCQLSTVDAASTTPLAQPLTLCDVTRADQPVASLSSQVAMANAPEPHERGFAVPAVLESGA